jgi:hypothetical protein
VARRVDWSGLEEAAMVMAILDQNAGYSASSHCNYLDGVVVNLIIKTEKYEV